MDNSGRKLPHDWPLCVHQACLWRRAGIVNAWGPSISLDSALTVPQRDRSHLNPEHPGTLGLPEVSVAALTLAGIGSIRICPEPGIQ
ncbi:hypothetical protein NWI01_30660 [Nitrobacter winogradskyi]|uniref:Uncharacterized protein n=1 Tax=Nitrobacter winogradskyi TaxID=913 RepID=A0A4Y3WE72_NITWI|nr:hypothetical protein NWI01_30660 [Nitrobacter winogradskyi]